MDWVYGEVWWQLGDFYYNPKHGLIGKSQAAFISSHFEVGTGMMMDPDTIVRICQSEQKGFCLLFLFHLFGNIISALLTCLLLFHVERWCFYSKQTVRLDFSDLTKLPGEEQVDIIAWGTQIRKNIWVFPKKYGKPPQIIHFYRVFHYKPSIFGYPFFWKHPFFQLWVFGSRLWNDHFGCFENRKEL